MKIQELAIIFIIIILPISLLLSEYTQFQIQTLKTQTAYDAKLTSATYDAIKAFQLNTKNETYSDLADEKVKDLEASINAFRNSLMSTFKLNGYTEEELNNYIPALVYTLYDGFYIYSPYNNTNHRYLSGDESVTKIKAEATDEAADGNGENIYGLKPYINYSCRYVYPNTTTPTIDVVITYALDNFITVQGIVGDEYVNKGGYLIDNISLEDRDGDGYYNSINDIVSYNGVGIYPEHLKEEIAGKEYSYVKYDGTKYYLDETNERIITISNGTIQTHATKTNNEEEYNGKRELILNNNRARQYYIEADKFTEWFKSTDLVKLQYQHAVDEAIIDDEGQTELVNVWANIDTLKEIEIFAHDENESDSDYSNSIENELSNFNQHRLAVIRHKIETNLAIAISNYNEYSNVQNVFQMPELKEYEWDQITHNISLISFLQGLPIGGKVYNGYTLVTNSESEEVVLEDNIYILGRYEDATNDKWTYHRIGDKGLEEGNIQINAGRYHDSMYGSGISAGRLNLDFLRNSLISNDISTYYYYPLSDYNASYDSVVMQNNVTPYDDIYKYINDQKSGNPDLAQAFYTALGRERMSKYNNNITFDSEPVEDVPTTGGGTETPEPIEQCTINYWLTGGVGILASQTVDIGTEISIDSTIPTRVGHEFLGWDVSSNATNVVYNPEDTITLESDIDLYAVWKSNIYTIEYEANGGTGAPTAQTKEYGSDITLSPINPTRTGYNFLGWATTSSATSAQYQPEDPYTENESVTLYAVWQLSEYTITYEANGGSGAPAIQEKTHGISVTLSSTKPTRSGYNFLGWATTSTATSAQYQPGGTYTENVSVTLYAVWEAKTYTIIYNANGGNGAPATQTKTYGTSIALSTTIPTRDEYNFLGWATTPTATSAQYQPGETYTEDASVALYAVWESNINIYTITYNANGGSGAPAIQEKTHGISVTLSSTKPTRSGYNFLGWATTSTATSAQYQPGGTYTEDASVTLYAVWQKEIIISYKITYNANGGSGAPAYQTKTYGTSITLSTTIPTREGYNFVGWATSSTATSVQYQPGGTYTANANATLYAVWEANTYTLIYDANEGTGVPANQTWKHGEELILTYLEEDEYPTKNGYTFWGWGVNETDSIYYPGQNLGVQNGNMTLYAIWEPISVTEPYIPSGFSHVDGTDLDTGYTIQDSSGNQYVWIEVPRTTDVYSSTTLTLNLDSLSGDTLTTAYNTIETELQTYTSTYRDSSYADTYSFEDATGLTSSEYTELKQKMLKSVFENGGFYIGKYETGTTNRRTKSGSTTGYTAVVQANAYPYNYVTRSQAQSLASGMNSGEYTSSLMFGLQWDLVMKYLETNGVSTNELNSDSTSWGNYSGSQFKITSSNARYYGENEYGEIGWYTISTGSVFNGGSLITSGASDYLCKQNMYDIAGNLWEYTLESTPYSFNPCSVRGGGYSAASRNFYNEQNSEDFIGFRISIF